MLQITLSTEDSSFTAKILPKLLRVAAKIFQIGN